MLGLMQGTIMQIADRISSCRSWGTNPEVKNTPFLDGSWASGTAQRVFVEM
jgi:hypothetical protein